jgi:hypothetical protein
MDFGHRSPTLRGVDTPISPELCLVDPELARAMREQMPDEPNDLPLRAPTPGTRRTPATLVRPRLRRAGPRVPAALPRIATAAVSLVAIVLAGSSASVRGAIPVNALTDHQSKTHAAAPQVLLVPNVCRLTYVFAKGALEDAGFAWKVEGDVQGYAASHVARQLPAPGSVILATGTPTITLTLARNTAYKDRGVPDNSSPYDGTKPVTIDPAHYVGSTDCERVSAGRMQLAPAVAPARRLAPAPR